MTTHLEAARANTNAVVRELQRIQSELAGKPGPVIEALAVLQVQITLALVQAVLSSVDPEEPRP